MINRDLIWFDFLVLLLLLAGGGVREEASQWWEGFHGFVLSAFLPLFFLFFFLSCILSRFFFLFRGWGGSPWRACGLVFVLLKIDLLLLSSFCENCETTDMAKQQTLSFFRFFFLSFFLFILLFFCFLSVLCGVLGLCLSSAAAAQMPDERLVLEPCSPGTRRQVRNTRQTNKQTKKKKKARLFVSSFSFSPPPFSLLS